MDTLMHMDVEQLNLESRAGKSAVYSPTIADALFLLPLFIAVILRLGSLGLLPVVDTEASHGLAALSQMRDSVALGYSPAYATLTNLLFQFFGDSDITLRFIPALAGIGLVLTPLFWRKWIGSIGAFVTAMLFAVSPSLTVTARTASGDSLALLSLMFVAIGWLNWRDQGKPRWAIVGAVALGLGLVSSPLFYAGFLVLGLTWLFSGSLINYESATSFADLPANTLGWFVGTLFGVGTLFLLRLNQLGAIADLPIALFRDLGFSSLTDLFSPLLLIGRYELATLTLTLVAVLWVTVRNRPFGLMLTYWLTLSLIVSLLFGQPVIITLVVLPSYLLLGFFSNHIYDKHRGAFPIEVTLGLLIPFAGMMLQIGRFAKLGGNISLFDIFDDDIIIDENALLFLLLVVVMTLITLAILTRSWAVSGTGTWLGLLTAVLLSYFVFQWGTAWWLGHEGRNDLRAGWQTETVTDSDMRFLQETLTSVSANMTSGDTSASIFSEIDTPALRWYLRDFSQTTFGEGLPLNFDSDIVLSRIDVASETLLTGYSGTEFGYQQQAIADTLPTTFTQRWRWWFFRNADSTSVQNSLILWAKQPVR